MYISLFFISVFFFIQLFYFICANICFDSCRMNLTLSVSVTRYRAQAFKEFREQMKLQG